MRDGKDVCLFASGVILKEALDAAKILDKEKIFTKVVNVHTIKLINSKEQLNKSII